MTAHCSGAAVIYAVAGQMVASMLRLAGTAGAYVVTDVRSRHGRREVVGSELGARAACWALVDRARRGW